ncbi:hypothetical protein K491DRAFT_672723 [Lophiostoma macrostomum CBS 122681]|uniref:Xylanolytic transcriptional activator regulatory domain-containing protein n=1 Tax=Lophiostoma macrostomum CBS 122681 TaxID=1314788 RepID=A0A6A6TU83_9PLEO|nr:hypothetical protein K491DRAFT_672723 [Lophiostoma macrostomum CBS 122681]
MEPVSSLEILYKDSTALFWAIAFTASRHHPRHSSLYHGLREPFQILLLNLFSTPVQSLKDLQALLIVCQWPFEVERHSEDPSWQHIGAVVNAALHMGLDKPKNEVLFGSRRANRSINLYDPKYRRRTWMKVFETSTQLSTWQGLQPHISSASSLQRLAEFCEEETAGEVIAMTEIQRHVARNTISLEDLSIHGPQVSLVRYFTQEMGAIRKRYTNVWTASTEINLQGAMVYVLTHCLLLADNDQDAETQDPDAQQFVTLIMQQGHDAAIRLIKVVEELGLATATNPAYTRAEDGGAPLLAHPKQHFRLAFQACLFLLKYLDHSLTASTSDQDAARTAVLKVHQIFKQFHSREEFQRAARTLEVLARAVVPGGRRIKTIVRTRMGASLNYNAVWTAAELRGRQHDPGFTVAASAALEPIERYPLVSASAPENVFPWGAWDDAAYDENAFGLEPQLFSGFPTHMELFQNH